MPPGGGLASLFRLAAVVATALMLVGLSAVSPAAIAYSLAVVGAEYVAGLVLRGRSLDLSAPLFAAGLYAAAELAYASLEARRPGGLGGHRFALAVGLVAAGGAALGYLLLVLALLPLSGSLVLTALGGAAAVVATGILGRLARRI